MWTKAHWARHEARLKEIISLHAVGQVARWLERMDPPRSVRATFYGRVVRALAWHLQVGGARVHASDRSGSRARPTTTRLCPEPGAYLSADEALKLLNLA